MTVELRPLGVKCNIHCTYCYQNPQRDAGNVPRSYDMKKMKAAIEKEGGPFSLFGGEALLVPIKDLEELWSWGFEKWGRNGVQTNGVLINQNHISLFKKYKVGVGISIDGPGELNDLRFAWDLRSTRDATARTENAIELLCREGVIPSLIVTLHRLNATREKLPTMHDWIRRLEKVGIKHVRLHILESENDTIRKQYSLSTEENVNALLSFLNLQKELKSLKFDMFSDMRKMLLGQDNRVTCVWRACDPYTTRSVRGVEGNGQRSNCGRTNKDGIDYVKANLEGFERYIALYHTPQEYGGCKDCRFFLMCKGQCPGTSIQGDWRNRSEYCLVWKALYTHLEKSLLQEGQTPISSDINKRKRLEKLFLDNWANGRNSTMNDLISKPKRS